MFINNYNESKHTLMKFCILFNMNEIKKYASKLFSTITYKQRNKMYAIVCILYILGNINNTNLLHYICFIICQYIPIFCIFCVVCIFCIFCMY